MGLEDAVTIFAFGMATVCLAFAGYGFWKAHQIRKFIEKRLDETMEKETKQE